MLGEIETLVQLQEGKDNEPIIFVHPIGGTLFIYKPLIARLITQHPIYGIQDNFLEGQFRHYGTLTEQAQYYIQKIFDRLSVSAISFAGLSSGGSLAFEMARQCLEYGVQVKQVLMFDTWVKTPFDEGFKLCFQKIILRQIEKLNMLHLLDDQNLRSQWLELLWERMGLLFTYNPRSAAVPATLFTALEGVPEYTVDERVNYAWGQFVSSFNIIPVAGNHETMLDLKYIEELSAKVNECLK